ncbi:MAG: hypothetical protein Q8M31_10310 [Beijerinckiaceae bacterium]|nr:hypothetical protein [Beijerinckiaceae bacterium]
MATANPELVVAGFGGVAAVLRKPYDLLQLADILRMLAAHEKRKLNRELWGDDGIPRGRCVTAKMGARSRSR